MKKKKQKRPLKELVTVLSDAQKREIFYSSSRTTLEFVAKKYSIPIEELIRGFSESLHATLTRHFKKDQV